MEISKEMIAAAASAMNGILGLSREEAAYFVLSAALRVETFQPAVIVNEDAGISELVIADVPTVTGGEMVVRPLFDMTTREIVGFQWDTALLSKIEGGEDGK